MRHSFLASAATAIEGRALCLRPDAINAMVSHLAAAAAFERGEEGQAGLGGFIGGLMRGSGAARTASRAMALSSGVPGAISTPYGERVDGVAIIRVEGVLFQEAWVFEWDGHSYIIADGYDRILTAIQHAVNDGNAQAVLLDVRSPGGVVAGCFEACDEIAALSARAGGGKMIVSHVNDQATSAAYGLISQTDRIDAAGSSLSANIGACRMHYGFAELLAKAGIKPTLAKSHDLKGGMSPDFPLDEASEALMNAEVLHASGMLVSRVATARGLSEDAINALQAAWFIAPVSKGHGLIDNISAFSATLSALAAETRPAAPAATATEEDTEMKRSVVLAALAAANLTAEQVAAVEAELPAEDEDDEGNEGGDAGANGGDGSGEGDGDGGGDDEKVDAKIAQAILALPEAKGREPLAARLAFRPGMTVEQAKGDLAAAPKGSTLGDRMQGRDPKLSANGGGGGADDIGAMLVADAAARRR